MKLWYAVRESFSGLVRRSPFVFFMICLGVLICNMMFTWFYGNMKYTLIHSGHTRVTVEDLQDTGLTDEDLIGLVGFGQVIRISFHALDPQAAAVTYDAPETRGMGTLLCRTRIILWGTRHRDRNSGGAAA